MGRENTSHDQNYPKLLIISISLRGLRVYTLWKLNGKGRERDSIIIKRLFFESDHAEGKLRCLNDMNGAELSRFFLKEGGCPENRFNTIPSSSSQTTIHHH